MIDLTKHMDSATDITRHGEEEPSLMLKKPENLRKNDTENAIKNKSKHNRFLIMLFGEEKLNDSHARSVKKLMRVDIMTITINLLTLDGCVRNITKNIIMGENKWTKMREGDRGKNVRKGQDIHLGFLVV